MLTLGGLGRWRMLLLPMGLRLTMPMVPAVLTCPMLLLMLLADMVPTLMVGMVPPAMVVLGMLEVGFMVVVGTMPGFMVGMLGGSVCWAMFPIIWLEPMLTMGLATIPGLMLGRMPW